MNRESEHQELASADLLLVRHARPELRAGVKASEWRLAADAEEATTALAAEVDRLLEPTGRRVTQLWSSTEPKAIGTARALGAVWGLGVEQLEDLGEHRRGPLPIVGDLEWRETIATLFARPDELVLGSETATEARLRFTAAIGEVLRFGEAGDLSAVATHATVMTLLLAAANGIAAMSLWGSLGMPDALFVDSRRGFRLVGRAWQRTP
ncbi:MAG TPA: histidine phosphatase family protein [Trueperaceae bacterium]